MTRIFLGILLSIIHIAVFCQEVKVLDLGKLRKPDKDPFLSEIASDLQFIKLETKPDCLIGSISSISRIGENYLITSEAGKTLYVFNNQGRYICSIGRLGKGPGEFLEIYGLSIDPLTNHIYVLDNGQVKLIEYNQDGRFIQEKKLNFYATGVKVTKSGFVFVLALYMLVPIKKVINNNFVPHQSS